jgi:hypothetical protein
VRQAVLNEVGANEVPRSRDTLGFGRECGRV